MSWFSKQIKSINKRVAKVGRKVGLSKSDSETLASLSTGGLDSAFIERNVKQVDRFLDDVIGIDHAGTRNKVQVGVATVAGAFFGGIGGQAAGSAIGNVVGAGVTAAVGPSVGATTSALITPAIVATGASIGGQAGGALGSTLAASAVAKSLAPDALDPLGVLDPAVPFALPTNFELSSARGELQSGLRKKRKRGKTDFTGGLFGGGGVAPRLRTA